MENNGKSMDRDELYAKLVGKQRWNIYKSLHVRRWVVWNSEWANKGWPPMKFDTWQEAIDYVNWRIKS